MTLPPPQEERVEWAPREECPTNMLCLRMDDEGYFALERNILAYRAWVGTAWIACRQSGE